MNAIHHHWEEPIHIRAKEMQDQKYARSEGDAMIQIAELHLNWLKQVHLLDLILPTTS